MKDVFDLKKEMLILSSRIESNHVSVKEGLIICERILEDYKDISRMDESEFNILKSKFVKSFLISDRVKKMDESIKNLEEKFIETQLRLLIN